MSKAARIRYLADWDYVDKKATEFSLTQEVIEKLDSIEPSAEKNAIQGIKVNWQLQEPDQYRVVSLAIPEVEDNLDSISSTNALSAKQGRVLYNRIKNLEGLGKFLSNWDSTTWMPTTNPTALPYEYHSWDYYIVGRVWATNYRPEWTSYRWIPSTDLETEEVKVWDFYFFNWATWELLLNTDRQIPIDESLSTTSTNPVENRVVTAALNLKANDADISVVGKTNDFNDLNNIPDIPDSLDDLSWTSDDITEWSTHLFLTSAERTKLVNTTGVNTWDETNASIMSKLGASSATTNGYLTVADWNTFNNKQASISDLETIRSNASAWKNASDTIATYGDVVTHDANEFATAAQGWKADTALQPWDNVSELTNDAWYVTDAYHDSTKQDKLIAWTNIQIANDWKTISATDTTYVAWDFDIKDLADSTGLRTEWSWKQDALTAWSNIQIAQDGTISATDTTYSAWAGISISNNNVISAIDNKASWGSIEWTLSNQTDLQSALNNKQDTLTAWVNIQIAQDGTISATDTTYTAGTWIDITNWVISNTQTSAEWGNITWTLSDQTDLQSALDAKQDDMVILKYGISTWNDFITAYNKNAVVYCRASSNSNPASGAQTRLAFMAYVNQETNPTSVEFQYYRSRSDHNSAANQLDQVFVYQLTSSNWWTWSVIERNTAAKAVAWTWIWLSFGSGNMTITNTWVTSVNSQTWDVTLTIPTVPTNVSDFVNDAWYITANDLPTVDTSMSDSSTNAVQNKVIKSYVDTQVQEATAWAVSDTAYWSSWDWITGIAPSKNAVYDKISAMDTTIAWKQNTISDLSTIRTGAWKWATAVQPWDNVSTLTNDAGFITKAVNDLTNYYTKSETYTKSEVADYVANFAWFKVVATLPTTDIKTTIIYLLWPVGTWADKYEEYIYSNNTWVKIWETSVDLTNYFNTSTDNSDSITQGSTNLFLTSAERTKLSNTSGTNTGDETKATIQSKLWAASSSASGYLTSTDWSTFNNKQNALSSSNAWENIEINNWVISATNAYIITDSDVTITTTDEYWVAPYNTSYYYTNIEISTNADIKWVEWAIYGFICDSTWVDSAHRNARIRIWSSWNWIPVFWASTSILWAHSYFVSTQTRIFVYKTTNSTAALHLLNDTSYSAMSVAEWTAGTATSNRVMRADYLKQIIQAHSIIPSKDWGQTITNTDSSNTTPLSLTSSASSSYIAFNGSGWYLWSYWVKNDKTPQFYNGTSHTLAYISWAQFGSGWDWVADTAPSQNAVYDKITAMDTTISGKQDALATQTAYTAQGSATKVPQITTNSLWQVTWITEVTITQPTVNNSTITYTQAWDTITTTSTNQSSASTVALRWDIFVTQTEYNALPSTKLTDWNTYIIYE